MLWGEFVERARVTQEEENCLRQLPAFGWAADFCHREMGLGNKARAVASMEYASPDYANPRVLNLIPLERPGFITGAFSGGAFTKQKH